MGAWRTGQQSNRSGRWVQRLKRYPWWLRLLLVTVICGGIVSAIYILIMHGKFWGQDQATNNQFILTTVLTVGGIVICIFLYFFPLPNNKEDPHVPPPAPIPTGNPSLIWHVPYPYDLYFTLGSGDILKDLHDKFHKNKTGLLTQPKTISGMGGLGKTATALAYAYRYSSDYHAVLWANADSREALISDFMSIADRLNLPEKDAKDQALIIDAVKQWLSEKEDWLLILDNADDLKMLNEFIPPASKGHILLTTHAAGIGKLDGVEVKKMEPEDGALFLLRRAKKIPRDALLEQASANDIITAKEIVAAMDGLPLALDQAGAYIDTTGCSLSFYLERYQKEQKELLELRSGPESADPDPVHPDPVASTWSLSFKKVQRANRAAANLLRLCVFLSPDAIPEELITEGASAFGWTLQRVPVKPLKLEAAIGELRKYSFVRRNSDQTLTIHRLVQIALRNSMTNRAQRQWAERTVRTVNRAFPDVEFATWERCRRELPHALVCAALIRQWNMTFAEAARLLQQAGSYLLDRAQYPEAEPLLQRALAIKEKAFGSDHTETASILNNLAELYSAQGNYKQAEPLLQGVLAIKEKAFGSDHTETASTLNNLGLLHRNQGNYKQAEPLLQRALAIKEKAFGSDHTETASTLNNLAILYSVQGKYDQAEPLLQRALTIKEKELGPDHPDTAMTLNNLGLLYKDQAKDGQAEPLLQRALSIYKKALGPDHPDTAMALNNLAELYRIQGKYEQAEPLFQQARVILEKSKHPNVATILRHLAEIYCDQGRYDAAEPLFKKALDIHEQTLGPDHPDVAMDLESYAVLLRKTNRRAEAEEREARAKAIQSIETKSAK